MWSTAGREHEEMAVFTSTVNEEVYIKILDTFGTPSIKSKYSDDEFMKSSLRHF